MESQSAFCISLAVRIITLTPAARPKNMNTIIRNGEVPNTVSSPYPIPNPITRPETSSITNRHAI